MAHFEFSSIIPAPREKVFEFHADLENLISILPPSMKAECTEPPSKFETGMEFEIRATRFGVSVLWGGIIEEFRPPELFVDRQTDGPFSLWIHTHRFEEHASGTLVKDLVEYEIPFGLFGKLLDDLYARRELKKFFDYRHKKTREHFEGQGES